jgi:hypothetical protein
MKHTITNIKIIFSVFTIISLGIAIMSCSSSEYICFKVKKSELMPDSLELGLDSLIVGGLKLATLAQRYCSKPVTMGGGGNSFAGFVVPTNLQKTANGIYAATPNGAVDCVIVGTRKQILRVVVITVLPDTIAIYIN